MTFDEILQQKLTNIVKVSLDFAEANNFNPTGVYSYGYINQGFYYFNTFYKSKDQKFSTKEILPKSKNGILESSLVLSEGVKVLRQIETLLVENNKEVPLILQTIYNTVNHSLDVNMTYQNEFENKELSENYNDLFEDWKASS